MRFGTGFIIIANGRLTAGGAWTDGPTRFVYVFRYKRRLYQWNMNDRFPQPYA